MDPSKFTLEEAGELLKPHLPHLKFQVAEHCVFGGDESIVFEDHEYGLQTWDRTVTTTALLKHSDFVHKFPIRVVSKKKTDDVSVMLETKTLILVRADGRFGHWFYQQTLFEQRVKTLPCLMTSTMSQVIPLVTTVQLENATRIPENYRRAFVGYVDLWVEESLPERKAFVDSLDSLHSKCRELERKMNPMTYSEVQ
jgi:hypothetical protein